MIYLATCTEDSSFKLHFVFLFAKKTFINVGRYFSSIIARE